MKSKTYDKVSRAAFTHFQSLAQHAGIPATTDTGNAVQHGVHIAWAYREPLSQLQVDIHSKPFFVSYGQIWDALDPILLSSQTATV